MTNIILLHLLIQISCLIYRTKVSSLIKLGSSISLLLMLSINGLYVAGVLWFLIAVMDIYRVNSIK